MCRIIFPLTRFFKFRWLVSTKCRIIETLSFVCVCAQMICMGQQLNCDRFPSGCFRLRWLVAALFLYGRTVPRPRAPATVRVRRCRLWPLRGHGEHQGIYGETERSGIHRELPGKEQKELVKLQTAASVAKFQQQRRCDVLLKVPSAMLLVAKSFTTWLNNPFRQFCRWTLSRHSLSRNNTLSVPVFFY